MIMRKHQAPGSKLHGNIKSQAPAPLGNCARCLGLEHWSFSGAWCLVLGAFLSQASAQTNTNRAVPVSNRYLFIVETSRAMERRADGVLSSVQTLLNSAIGGQLRRGDTLGVWTYNEQLYGGEFPLQQWSPETHPGVVRRTVAFLQQQKYEKSARIDKVLPSINRLVQGSPFLTVILITEG